MKTVLTSQSNLFLLNLGLTIVLNLVLGAAVMAQPSSATSISFQGALNGAGGQPLPNGSYTLGFQFWDHPTGAAASNRVGGAVTVPGVAVSGGVASTAIPVQPDWFNGQTRYLGTTVQGVNAGQELLPRVLVTAVPYAIASGNIYPDPTSGDPRIIGTLRTSLGMWVENAPLNSFSYVGRFNQGYYPNWNGTGREADFYRLIGQGDPHTGFGVAIGQEIASPVVWMYSQPGNAFKVVKVGFGEQVRDGEELFAVHSGGNVGIGTVNPMAKLEVNGTTRTTVLQITSARAAKEGFAPVDAAAVLAKVAALPITTWAYTNSHGVCHLGPVAEDFHAAFALGDSAQHIATVDADGVALAAIQGLHQLVTAQQTALRARESEVHTLQERLEKLERLVTELAGQRKEAQ